MQSFGKTQKSGKSMRTYPRGHEQWAKCISGEREKKCWRIEQKILEEGIA